MPLIGFEHGIYEVNGTNSSGSPPKLNSECDFKHKTWKRRTHRRRQENERRGQKKILRRRKRAKRISPRPKPGILPITGAHTARQIQVQWMRDTEEGMDLTSTHACRTALGTFMQEQMGSGNSGGSLFDANDRANPLTFCSDPNLHVLPNARTARSGTFSGQ